MTRENKLALVIGFGLVLFVGILIADHFAVGDRQHTEQLGRGAHADWPNHSDPSLIAVHEAQREDRLTVRPASDGRQSNDRNGRVQPASGHDDERHVPTVESNAGRTSGDREGGDSRSQVVEVDRYTVQRGDSMSKISERFYGTSTLAEALARYNDMSDVNRIHVGRVLSIPRDPSVLGGGSSARAGDDAPGVSDRRPATFRSYTMQEGDTLSRVAARFLGSADRWRELHELNKDVIANPNAIPVGTVIRIPSE